jgi:uncharacterized oligopeptide transporter (OPT) family protein
MKGKHVIYALLTGAGTLVVSFVITNVAYMAWAEWRYPQTSSMAGISAFVFGLMVAPICALIAFGLVLYWTGRKRDSN